MKLNKLTVLAAAMVSTMAIAQQTRQTNLYGFNKYSLNPAYAGYTGCTEVNFSHLNQWVKVEGAPVTNYLSANTRFGKAFGLGGEIMLDRLGMLQQFSASLGASYGIKFGDGHHVRLGISAGYFQLRIDPTEAIYIDNNDVIVDGGMQSSGALNSQAGLLYAFRGLELSFSSQQLVETRSNADYPNLDGFGLTRHFTGYGAYNILLNKRLALKPSVLYKGIMATSQFDFNVDLNYNDFIYGGLGYRTDVGMIGRLGVNVKDIFTIAYAYEMPIHNVATYGAGSHEIALALRFCKDDNKRELPPEVVTETVHDTVYVVEEKIDTMMVERVDTVYIKDEAVSDANVKQAMINVAESLEFEFDKSIIKKSSYADLEALTNMLLVRSELKIKLAGHTDNVGTEEYNMKLSRNRVEAIKKFFVVNGVDASRVEFSYFGESKPIASNDTEEGRAQNRRVEMEIIK